MDNWNNLIREYLTGTALAGRIIMVVMAITFILVYLTDLII
tara:strand:+ start:138 stop:260 length:123 start_codon:yes stop_codon:yes gene_type:complete